ncbi:mediator of RNA polymerase II transcription subunit 9 [Uranotaenia lowii]|uniref:mediator of RNA polymerase II transcription subunit 9 n=1 Tax=Uranotaenia lowii TaxID=190385 RepID=UPI0024798C5B|nr:mediator of RNA polymerase II transcription subunit 9 [Uranotaenia lowii]
MDTMQLMDTIETKSQILADGENIKLVPTNNSAELEVQKPTDIEILPVIYDIIRSVEKDPVDNASKQKESQECSQKVLELHARLESARMKIQQLNGIDYSKEEQLRRLDSLRKQLALKQQLIKKYKNVQF